MEIKNLDFSFKNQKVLKNINLRIEPQKVHVFLGPSGSGKSTLLRLFAGLLKSSEVFLKPDQNQAKSFVFQEATLLPWKNVEKNILLPFEISSKKADLSSYKKLVQTLKISDCLQRYPDELSGGQKMRVSIARALVTQPKILFMDEPFSALDETTRLNLQDELLVLQKELQMTLLFVTHSYYEAAFLADRIIILSPEKPSQIIYDQSQNKTFKDRYDLAYLKKVQELAEIINPHTNKKT